MTTDPNPKEPTLAERIAGAVAGHLFGATGADLLVAVSGGREMAEWDPAGLADGLVQIIEEEL